MALARLVGTLAHSSLSRPSTSVESPLQIGPFMQSKPNLLDGQMNVSSILTKDYENISNWTFGQSKPNSNPIKPNSRKAKMNVNSLITKCYRKNDVFAAQKTNPIKPNQTQSQNPIPTLRQAFFAHQRSRVDLPLGK